MPTKQIESVTSARVPAIGLETASMPNLRLALHSTQEPALYLVDGEVRRWSGQIEAVQPLILGERGKSEILGYQPMLDKEAALQAGRSATAAWNRGLGAWPNATAQERIATTENFLSELEKRRERIVELLMWEIGKPLESAQREFDRTITFIREAIVKYSQLEDGWKQPHEREGVSCTQGIMPLGTVLCMGPSNYPLNESLTTAIPAALIGNSVILKTPRYGVLLFNAVMEALAAAYPAGVVNVIGGDGRTVITPLMETGQIDGLAFIGTERAASAIMSAHPRRDRIPRLLGLSAKNPAVVLADADLDEAVAECVKGALSFNGQRCTALKVIYVQRAVADEFAQKLGRAVEQLKTGMPWEAGVELTPLYEADKCQWLSALVDDAIAKGAEIINVGGGNTNAAEFTPAVLYPASTAMRITHEEQFGPVVPIVPFDSLDEVLGEIAAMPYGQQVSLFCQEGHGHERAGLIKKLLLVGGSRLNLNMQSMRGPDDVIFGGRRDAGVGYVSVEESLTTFAVRSVIAEVA